jgi:hypothetical protein
MPQPNASPTDAQLKDAPPPDPALVPLTCPWAQDGLNRALQGMGRSSIGVSEYHIGSRGLHYVAADKQIGSVGWWSKWVEFLCGTPPLPTALTGDETAMRVILRDV